MKVRITVTLPKPQVDAVRREVQEGHAASVSEYVSQALRSRLGPHDDEYVSDLRPWEVARPPAGEEQAAADGTDDGAADASAPP